MFSGESDESLPIWPELLKGDHVAVAHKPNRDGLYYGGVGATALAWFLDEVALADPVQRYVNDHLDELDHLSFDVGVDFEWVDDRWTVAKAGVYGSL